MNSHSTTETTVCANPGKTQVTAFHLWNREAKRSLKVSWNRVDLENTTHPKYLGVTLVRTLSCKQHIQNTYKRWGSHSGHKLLCKLCRTFPPPAMGARFTVFGQAGHADPLDGWRCSSHKRVMSRRIQVRQH